MTLRLIALITDCMPSRITWFGRDSIVQRYKRIVERGERHIDPLQRQAHTAIDKHDVYDPSTRRKSTQYHENCTMSSPYH